MEGIDFRLDYERISYGDQSEYSGILHLRDPIAFICNEDSFSPADIEPACKDAIRQAIRQHEDSL
jgi:hypothetical protein